MCSFCQAKKLILGDVGGTFSPDEQIVLGDRHMGFLLNFMPYLYKMTREGMCDFACLLGVSIESGTIRHPSKDYCFRKMQHFFFQIYKTDLACYNIEFPGFWRMGFSNFDGVLYVQTKGGPHPCYYDIIESILNDPTGDAQIKEFRRIYKQIDYTDFVGMILCYDHSGTRREYHDILSVSETEARFVIELTGMPPLQPLRGPGHSAAAAAAEDREPMPEDDVDFHDRDNLYTDIASPTAIPTQDPL